MKANHVVTVLMVVELPSPESQERYRTLLASLHNGLMWWARIQSIEVEANA